MHFRTIKELDSTEGTVLLFRENLQGERHRDDKDLILFPQPSTDPNDPLRWPRWRKNMAYASVCAFACTNNISGTVYSDVFVLISRHFNVSVDEASGLIAWVILTLGVSNFIWVPSALYFGKRPVFILACAITFAAAIWAASTDSFGSLQAACVVGGFGGGASEALGAAIINDIYFLHERGSKMAWNLIMLAFGSSIGPLIGGYLIESKGLKWGKWLSAIFLGVNLLMIIFFVPETRFNRSLNASDSSDQNAKPIQTPETATDAEASSSLDRSDAAHPEKSTTNTHSSLLPTDPSIPRKPYFALLNPWSGTTSGESFFDLMFRPIPLIVYPACLMATFIYSICLAPTVMVNVMSGSILIPPPYNFTMGNVGLINIAGMIGQAGGFFIGGVLIDRYSAYRARRNKGIFLPEERLALLFLPSSLVFAGTVLFGFAAEKQMHWAVIFVAYGLMSVGLTGVASIAMVYVCDSYFPVAAECLELINGFKNIVAFGFIRGTVPWIESRGYESAFGTIGGIFAAFVFLAIALVFWGPKIRHHTSTHWRLISWEKAHIH
ncbi:MFS general substrate transporter [Daldinia caldariorum]|uniref:MFS general substrate transporter n=1 Tax=Daldinia caldariorum TaxID=326644 RepID=UPI0020079E13|nr:MFS general substrate transporter [Daldinia caldariorum]KAI1467128.1 MFS general substrate transporter [Daldinia caldariorum]